MNPFVRFIFALLIVGSAISLGIVLLADAHSERQQQKDLESEQTKFAEVMARFNARLRHGEIAVEWQKIDATQQVLETSLLVRIYRLDAEGEEVPLPVVRVIVPHNRVNIDGMMLDFDVVFPEKYATLRNEKLAYFEHIYADGQMPAERYTLMPRTQVPRSTQIHPERVTHYEIGLWQYLWDLIESPRLAAKNGLKVTHLASASCAVENGSVYSIFLGFEGVKIVKNEDGAVLTSILREAHQADAEAAAGDKEDAKAGSPQP